MEGESLSYLQYRTLVSHVEHLSMEVQGDDDGAVAAAGHGAEYRGSYEDWFDLVDFDFVVLDE